MVKIRR